MEKLETTIKIKGQTQKAIDDAVSSIEWLHNNNETEVEVVKSDVVNVLRSASELLENDKDIADEIHFPELLPEMHEQEAKVYHAAKLIASTGDAERGHKVKKSDLAALIHYLADMIGD